MDRQLKFSGKGENDPSHLPQHQGRLEVDPMEYLFHADFLEFVGRAQLLELLPKVEHFVRSGDKLLKGPSTTLVMDEPTSLLGNNPESGQLRSGINAKNQKGAFRSKRPGMAGIGLVRKIRVGENVLHIIEVFQSLDHFFDLALQIPGNFHGVQG